MNNNRNINLLILLFFFIVNCGMIAPNQVPKPPNQKNTTTHIAFQKEREKSSKIKRKKLRKTIKYLMNVVDSGALLIAIGAVIVMAILVYYFFSLGFLTGVLALVAVVFLLYLLFQYLEY